MVHDADAVVVLETVNGTVKADTQVTMQVNGIREAIGPYLLGDSPDVLSVGTRCELHGYGFYWPPYSKFPYYMSPDGVNTPWSQSGSVLIY